MLIASEFRDPQNSFFVHIYGLPSFENDLCSSLLREHASCRYLLPKNVWRRCWEQSKDCIQEVSEAGFEKWSGMAKGGGYEGSRQEKQQYLFCLGFVWCFFVLFFFLLLLFIFCQELLC